MLEGRGFFFERFLKTLNLGLQGRVELLDLLFLACQSDVQHAVLGLEPVVRVVRRLKNRPHRVVVAVGDRVELVIVTTGAAHGQPEKSGSENMHLVGDDIHPLVEKGEFDFPRWVGCRAQESGGG